MDSWVPNYTRGICQQHRGTVAKEVSVMPATATVKPSYPVVGLDGLTGRRLRKASFRRRFPERALHVVDIENLAGAAAPSLALVSEVQLQYLACLRFGADDQV